MLNIPKLVSSFEVSSEQTSYFILLWIKWKHLSKDERACKLQAPWKDQAHSLSTVLEYSLKYICFLLFALRSAKILFKPLGLDISSLKEVFPPSMQDYPQTADKEVLEHAVKNRIHWLRLLFWQFFFIAWISIWCNIISLSRFCRKVNWTAENLKLLGDNRVTKRLLHWGKSQVCLTLKFYHIIS